ncbi:MAG: hypothetical protein U9R25_12255 [Chloroflexota bacterium]|nr:hypothetical protein [Chloroflexota bacterium]
MNLIQRFAAWLATVTAVDVGKPNDGLIPVSSGTEIDKPWHELRQEFQDALEAWRLNPLARRLVQMVTAYVVGDGITMSSSKASVQRFLRDFYDDPENNILIEQSSWCDELTRSGELYLVLFAGSDGSVIVRAMPASRIEKIVWRPGDFRAELEYHEVPDSPGEEGRIWYAPRAGVKRNSAGKAAIGGGVSGVRPVMLHYAINRPVGCVRGESDLKAILPWLRRYSRWLEDRVRLNAVVRSFVWVVKVPKRLIGETSARYRRPPEAGSVVVVDRDNEEWQALSPSLAARDAANDGRAIRWMIVAGGPGTGLVDIGEGEDANLATASAMGEQRRRFLRRRQRLFAHMMVDLVVHGWNWTVESGLRRGTTIRASDIEIEMPDIAPVDNESLSSAAHEITEALQTLRGITGESEALRRLALRLMLKFAGETVNEGDFEEIVNGAFLDRAGEGE